MTDIKIAHELYAKSQYKEAFDIYQTLSKDDIVAQRSLGIMYLYGEGIAKDYGLAYKWLSLSAEGKDLFAQFNLAKMYHQGWGVKQDDNQSIHFATLSAEQGYQRAQLELANAYLAQGKSLESVKWLRILSEAGEPNGTFQLGCAYYQGYGVTKDHKEAVRLWTLSAEQNNPFAQLELGYMYQHGHGCALDKTTAFILYRKALRHHPDTKKVMKYIKELLTDEIIYNTLINETRLEDEVHVLKDTIVKLEERVETLQIEVDYRPEGKGYKEAEEHFQSLINPI